MVGMKRWIRKVLAGLLGVGCGFSPVAWGWQAADDLGRGLVAFAEEGGGTVVSWRSLASDAADLGFEVWRVREGREERVSGEGQWLHATHVTDPERGEGYVLRSSAGESWKVEAQAKAYWEIPLRPLEGYRAGDCSAGDLDGDGEYDLVVMRVAQPRDNGSAGMTRSPVLEAYKMDGRFLWRIDLGRNIREGEHYTQFMVYDLDGDGIAEVACKTADGSRDGTGRVIGDGDKDWRNQEEGSQRHGRILEGPEYLTVFDGRSGAERVTVDYVPGRDPIDGWGGVGGNGKNDSYGNRCDRFLACVAYLDGKRPSLVMCRGVYGRTVMAAWDFREGQLQRRWVFDSGISYPPFEDASPFSGMGGHSLSVADVDGDGRDEIVYQAMTVDDDGSGLYSTGRRHGDSMHVGDFDPGRPGPELYLISENEDHTVRFQTPGAGLHCARSGEMLWSHSPGVDISRGMVADVDPRHPGAEIWGGPGGMRNVKGEPIGPAPRMADWVVWWDGDLLRELYAGNRVFKWDPESGTEKLIFSATSAGEEAGAGRRRFARATPHLSADLFGDWREELVVGGPDGQSLRVYSTPEPTEHRLTCLMQDRQYRLSVVWQNVVYNKPPHVSYFLGHGMKPAR
jgi:rhamnogalacturonan endolyase